MRALVEKLFDLLLGPIRDWARRPRLRLCLDRERVPPKFEVPDYGSAEREVVLCVRNWGQSPAVDCVGRLEGFEVWQGDEWADEPLTEAGLAWEGAGETRTVTVRPMDDAPPRRLRLLHFEKSLYDSLTADVCLLDREATNMARPLGPDFRGPPRGANGFRFTVWVQPEGEEGAPARCQVEVRWTKSSQDGRRNVVEVDAEPVCSDSFSWGDRAIRFLTQSVIR